MSDRINPFLIDRILFFHIIQHYLEIFGFVHTFLIDRPNTPAWKWKSASPYISRIRGWINYKKSTFLGKPVPVTCLFKIFRAAGKSMNCYNKRIFLFVIRPIAGRYIDIPVPWQSCDIHNVPLATNLATAELLIKALDRGDLEWREMYK